MAGKRYVASLANLLPAWQQPVLPFPVLKRSLLWYSYPQYYCIIGKGHLVTGKRHVASLHGNIFLNCFGLKRVLLWYSYPQYLKHHRDRQACGLEDVCGFSGKFVACMAGALLVQRPAIVLFTASKIGQVC